jgi:putative transport protein
MVDQLRALFTAVPPLALFVSLFLGYLIGRVRVRSISLGGICGTLIVAIVIGQLGVTISDDAKNIAFATFIFALGFTAGPQFFANLNRQGLKLGAFTLVEVIAVLVLIVVWSLLLGLDPGTAAGLTAGSATESAMLGTATDAIGGLPVDPATIKTWQANVATAYSLSYLFGLITIVLFVSQFAEKMIRVDLRDAAEGLWARLGGGNTLKAGQAPAVPRTTGRIYVVLTGAGRTVDQVESGLGERATVERIRRDNREVDVVGDLVLATGDKVLLVGRQDELIDVEELLGPERGDQDSLNMTVESRDIWLTNTAIDGKTLQEYRTSRPTGRGGSISAASPAAWRPCLRCPAP